MSETDCGAAAAAEVEDAHALLLRDIEAMRALLERMRPESLTEEDKEILRGLLRELQAVTRLAE